MSFVKEEIHFTPISDKVRDHTTTKVTKVWYQKRKNNLNELRYSTSLSKILHIYFIINVMNDSRDIRNVILFYL